MNVIDIIKEYQKKDYKMCIYGMGTIGTCFYKKIIDIYNLNIDFFSAANIDEVDIGKEVKVKKKDLLAMKDNVLIFLLVEISSEKEILKDFAGKDNFKIITYNQIIRDEFFIRKFYDISGRKIDKGTKNEIALFTCITNGYDDVHEPEYIDKEIDYFVISEQPPKAPSVYRWIDVKKIVPKSIVDFKDQNRYCKMHGAEIFKEYKYSIYIDGSVLIKGQVSGFINKISDCGLALFRHPCRENIYEEGLKLYALGKYDNEGIINQLARYMEEGIPLETGLFSCGIIVRDNRSDITTKIMHEWFYEYINGANRDQLSFTYVLWKQGIDYNRIGDLGHIQDSDKIEFKWWQHKR